jgi:hypothetical protein
LGVALAILFLGLAWMSRGWPLIHDAPILHYIAWLIRDGATPYRDIFDMNTPGVYLIHLLVIGTLGHGSVAWRVFDLGWLGLTMLAIAGFVRPFGRGAAAVAALLFGVYHLAGGQWLAGQRDFVLCAFLLAGAALVTSGSSAGRDERIVRTTLGGLVAGFGITLKPLSALFLVLLVVLAAVDAARQRLRWWPAALAVPAGSMVAPLATVGWVAWTGGLEAFVATFADYVIPLYARLARVSPRTALSWWPFGWQVWGLFVVLVGAAAVPLDRTQALAGVRRRVALAGTAYGVIHFGVQGKGWEYHLYPLAMFACVCAGMATRVSSRPVRWIAAGAIALLTLTLAAKGVQETRPAWIVEKARRVGRIVADLEPRLEPGDTVQVLDTSEGGIHALYTLGVRQPTRFVYDFHFLHDQDHPVIRALRAEFMSALAAHPPKLVVLLEHGWPRGDYGRLAGFRELAGWLAAGYRIDREGDGYRIYAQRAGS